MLFRLEWSFYYGWNFFPSFRTKVLVFVKFTYQNSGAKFETVNFFDYNETNKMFLLLVDSGTNIFLLLPISSRTHHSIKKCDTIKIYIKIINSNLKTILIEQKKNHFTIKPNNNINTHKIK